MDKMDKQEMVSALADGQLQGEAFALGVQHVAADAAAREAWATYHLIGDVLRSAELAQATPADRFLGNLQARLAAEPPLQRPSLLPEMRVAAVAPQGQAANEGGWRWKAVAGFASVAAVAAVGWNLVGGAAVPAGQPQLAAAPAASSQVLAATERGTMIRDPRLDQLMAAHRQFGTANALQAPAGFLRNATFEGPAR